MTPDVARGRTPRRIAAVALCAGPPYAASLPSWPDCEIACLSNTEASNLVSPGRLVTLLPPLPRQPFYASAVRAIRVSPAVWPAGPGDQATGRVPGWPLRCRPCPRVRAWSLLIRSRDACCPTSQLCSPAWRLPICRGLPIRSLSARAARPRACPTLRMAAVDQAKPVISPRGVLFARPRQPHGLRAYCQPCGMRGAPDVPIRGRQNDISC